MTRYGENFNMRMYDIITKKKNNEELTKKEIDFFVKGYVDGEIPDYQVSALLMAICFNGMTEDESVNLTESMLNSGETLDLSAFGNYSVDKHSTGGVGDKTTLIIAPIVASLGGKLAKMSGRGLGHTGGTIDKLESIYGFKTSMSTSDFFAQAENTGLAVIGQRTEFVPADKKLYALRDVTATVNSIPLIASSIMSKKLAAGAKSIMLDVKVGSGAFMKSIKDAESLAKLMILIGKKLGRNVSAMITNMDVPLGRYVGNSLEVFEAVEVLNGRGSEDLKNITQELSANMISMIYGYYLDKSRKLVKETVANGNALKKFKEWVIAQGADAERINKNDYLPKAKYKFAVLSPKSGFISSMNAEEIGICACMTGAGRENKDDIIDLSAGIELLHKTGDYISAGEELAYIYTNKNGKEDLLKNKYISSVVISDTPPDKIELIYKILK